MKARVMFPTWLRVWHWANAFLYAVLLATGFSLHFAGVGAGGVQFRWSVLTHNVLGVALVGAYAYYLLAMAVTGHWRQYLPHRGQIADILLQARYYLYGIFVGAHHPFVAIPERRFNPIQQLAYIMAVLTLMPGQIVTGVALLFPDRVPEQAFGMNGIMPWAVGHAAIAYFTVVFLFIHLYLALTVGEPHTGVKSMLLGDRMPPPEPGAPHH